MNRQQYGPIKMTSQPNRNLQKTALQYLESGLCPLPTGKHKQPLIDSWKDRQGKLPDPQTVKREFSDNSQSIAVIEIQLVCPGQRIFVINLIRRPCREHLHIQRPVVAVRHEVAQPGRPRHCQPHIYSIKPPIPNSVRRIRKQKRGI